MKAEGWDAIPKAIETRHLKEWISLIESLDPGVPEEFATAIQAFLAAGFSAGELGRAARYDTGTVLKWAQRSMAPPRDESRRSAIASMQALLETRFRNWGDVDSATDGLKSNRKRTQSADIIPMLTARRPRV